MSQKSGGPETTKIPNEDSVSAALLKGPEEPLGYLDEEVADLTLVASSFDPQTGRLELQEDDVPKLNAYLRSGGKPPSSICVTREPSASPEIVGFETGDDEWRGGPIDCEYTPIEDEAS